MSGPITTLARSLRRKQTPSEALLWKCLRNRKLNGFKFLRQQPIFYIENGTRRFFIADFYCSERKLVVELDGSIHQQLQESDARRDQIMTDLGLRVLRINNWELEDLKSVLSRINAYLLS
jgi:very-short-patch-repair endonuclease